MSGLDEELAAASAQAEDAAMQHAKQVSWCCQNWSLDLLHQLVEYLMSNMIANKHLYVHF